MFDGLNSYHQNITTYYRVKSSLHFTCCLSNETFADTNLRYLHTNLSKFPRLFLPFPETSWQYFLTLFTIMNGQPCCRVNFSRHLIPLVAPVFWNTGTLLHATTNYYPQARSWLVDISFKSKIFLCEILISMF